MLKQKKIGKLLPVNNMSLVIVLNLPNQVLKNLVVYYDLTFCLVFQLMNFILFLNYKIYNIVNLIHYIYKCVNLKSLVLNKLVIGYPIFA